jgi:hypothetical protein
MGDQEQQMLELRLEQARQHIERLEQEILRLKMLLNGDNTMMNSLGPNYPRDRE